MPSARAFAARWVRGSATVAVPGAMGRRAACSDADGPAPPGPAARVVLRVRPRGRRALCAAIRPATPQARPGAERVGGGGAASSEGRNAADGGPGQAAPERRRRKRGRASCAAWSPRCARRAPLTTLAEPLWGCSPTTLSEPRPACLAPCERLRAAPLRGWPASCVTPTTRAPRLRSPCAPRAAGRQSRPAPRQTCEVTGAAGRVAPRASLRRRVKDVPLVRPAPAGSGPGARGEAEVPASACAAARAGPAARAPAERRAVLPRAGSRMGSRSRARWPEAARRRRAPGPSRSSA